MLQLDIQNSSLPAIARAPYNLIGSQHIRPSYEDSRTKMYLLQSSSFECSATRYTLTAPTGWSQSSSFSDKDNLLDVGSPGVPDQLKKKRGGGQSSGRLTMAPRHERFHQTRVFLIVRLEGMRSEYGGGSLVPLGGVFLRRCDVVGVDVGEARQNDLQREAQLLAEKRSSKCSLHFSVPKSSTYVAIATKQLQMGKLEEHSRN